MKPVIVVFLSLVLSLLCCQQAGAQGWRETLNTADSLAELHEYDAAIEAGHLALARVEAEFGETDTAVVKALQGLAYFYMSARRYAESEPLNLRCLEILERAYGPDCVMVAKILTNRAGVLIIESRYSEAESLLLRAWAIYKKNYGPEHEAIIYCLCNLGVLYKSQGRYEEAESIYKQGLSIAEKTRNTEAPMFVRNLGSLYTAQGRYDEAVPYFRKLITLNEQLKGPEDWTVTTAMQGLAKIYRKLLRSEEAEQLLLRAVAISERNFPPDYPLGTGLRNDLANLYVEMGKYAAAESLYVRVLTVREHAHALQDWTAETLEEMSRLYRLEDKHSEALKSAGRACRMWLHDVSDRLTSSAEKDALVFSRSARNSAGNYLACYFESLPADSPSATEAANIVLENKGLISDGMFERQKNTFRETDSTTLAISEAFKTTKRRLSQLFIAGPGGDLDGYRNEVDSLERQATLLEVNLSRHSAGFNSRKAHGDVDIHNVASLLTDRDVLVEYLQYDFRLLKPDTGIPRYMAVVLTAVAEPMIVDLGEASGIDQLVDSYCRHFQYVAAAGSVATESDKQEYARISGDLYGRIWQPLEKYVVDKDLVLIAPDGALNMVSFASLRSNDGSYLIEKHAVHYLSAGRDIVRLSDTVKAGSGLLALGDPDYDAPVSSRLMGRTDSAHDAARPNPDLLRSLRSNCGVLRDITLSPLPGTGLEIRQIARTWQETTQEPVVTCLGRNASEDAFKADAPGKRAIHLATHGYCISSNCESDTTQSGRASGAADSDVNPLLHSGLFLAGANLDGRGADSAGVEDGVLTAYEVSALDLTGTELVVLSACETGLGEVFSGEGVYGLRRAFQMAGAETVISTLWPVSDQLTAAFFGELYKRHGVPLPETIQRIQLEKIDALRRQGLVDHPMAWGAFVAYGRWR